jgi:3,4-dihydroxy 2-butanone 4-phosphate synthase/GTP cyclohydrolase II
MGPNLKLFDGIDLIYPHSAQQESDMAESTSAIRREDATLVRTRKAGLQIQRVVVSNLPTSYGNFSIYGYREVQSGMEHVALVYGTLPLATPTLVRIHSECLTGEAFGSLRCDCREQLDKALEAIAHAGSGVVVYLRGHEGRGIGLINKLRAYALQDSGRDTSGANTELGLPVDARDYAAAFAILDDLGVRALRLMTNNPDKISAADKAGFPVERIPLIGVVNADNKRYLGTKLAKFGHLFPDFDESSHNR